MLFQSAKKFQYLFILFLCETAACPEQIKVQNKYQSLYKLSNLQLSCITAADRQYILMNTSKTTESNFR